MTVAGERVAARLRNLAFGSMAVQETAFFDRNRCVHLQQHHVHATRYLCVQRTSVVWRPRQEGSREGSQAESTASFRPSIDRTVLFVALDVRLLGMVSSLVFPPTLPPSPLRPCLLPFLRPPFLRPSVPPSVSPSLLRNLSLALPPPSPPAVSRESLSYLRSSELNNALVRACPARYWRRIDSWLGWFLTRRRRTGDLVNRLASDVLLVQGSVTTSASQVKKKRVSLIATPKHRKGASHFKKKSKGCTSTFFSIACLGDGDGLDGLESDLPRQQRAFLFSPAVRRLRLLQKRQR